MIGLLKQSRSPLAPGALVECLSILLKAIERNVVVADDNDAKEFRSQIAALHQRCTNPQDTPDAIDGAADTLKTYVQRANQLIGRQRSGLMMLVSELTTAMAALPDVQRSSERLSALEEQIAAASTSGDLQASKARIQEFLALARLELLKPKQQISDLISGAISGVRKCQEQLPCPPAGPSVHTPDPLTGLPGRAYTEAELVRLHAQYPDCHVAIFVLKRLHLLIAKFGFSHSDELLLRFVQHLAQAMPDFNGLSRWAPAAFLVITPASVSFREVRMKVQAVELQRITTTLEWSGRSALVPIALNSRVVPLRDSASPDDLFRTLDAFVAEN
jgi:GGDEF domain-containing protein